MNYEYLNKLKKDLEIKEKVFELIKDGKSKEAETLLNERKDILSYFIKFKSEPDTKGHRTGKVILLHLGGWKIIYNSYYENEIQSDLDKLKKEIAEIEYLLQQRIFLDKQEEFLEIQKKDIEENKKDREKVNHFTFIVAFGVLVTIVFNMFQIFIQFKTSGSLHIMTISAIFLMIFTLFLNFIINTFNMKKEVSDFWKNSWASILFALALVALFILILFNVNDAPIKGTSTDDSMLLINQTLNEVSKTNSILESFANASINNQNNLNINFNELIEIQRNLTNKS